MSAKSVFKMGFLSMIAAIGLFGASNGFADAGHTTSNSEGVTANTGVKAQALEATEATRVVSADVQIAKTPAPRDQVVDSEGNFYRLIPLQTQRGSPQDAKTLSLSEMKTRLPELVTGVQEREEEVVVTKNGQPAAALINVEEYTRLKETLDVHQCPRRHIRMGHHLITISGCPE